MKFDKYQFAVLLLLFVYSTLPASNDLKNHPSPYLAMHGDDPVQWRDWGEAAVEEARNSGKLLYLSSGYFSCHWCHVMQRESYQNSEIAELLNKPLILNWFKAKKVFSSGIVESLNNKAKVTTRNSYGFRTYRGVEIALYHALGNLPTPPMTHRFC
jgi:thioredoxin-related protein